MNSHRLEPSDMRLRQYTAFAGCFLLGLTEASAQFAIYTDLDPDSLIQLQVVDTTTWGGDVLRGEIGIDLNRDGKVDLQRGVFEKRYSTGGIYLSRGYLSDAPVTGPGSFAMATNTVTHCSTWGSYTENELAIFWSGSSVTPAFNWQQGYQIVFNESSWGGGPGPWNSSTLASAGIKFNDGLAEYYGWVRMKERVVYDYAINPIAGQAIIAGPTTDTLTAAAVHSIEPNQINSIGNFSDFRIQFQVPSSETGIASYRVIAVKQDSLPTFSLAKSLALPADRYENILPTGADFDGLLNAGLHDSDGDGMLFNTHYHFLVMSVADSIDAIHPNLWSCSPLVQAKSLNAVAGQPVIIDVADHNDARDMQLAFTKAVDEIGIVEYRIVLWKYLYDPTLSALAALPAVHYESVLPTGVDVTTTLSAGLLDAEGEEVRSEIAYRFFVWTVADGVLLTADVLSEPSDLFATELLTREVQNLMAADISDFDSGADLQVSFDAAADEVGISSYRIYARPSALPSPDPSVLLALSADKYVELFPTGGSYVANFDGKEDIIGAAICGTCEYRLIALSVGDAVDFVDYDVVIDDEDIALSPANIDVGAVTLNQVAVVPDASAFEVSFTRAVDETHLAAYRVVLLRDPAAPVLADLYTLPSTSYFDITPTGADITTMLPATLMDYLGNRIAIGVPYRAVVLSVPDGIGANLWALSTPSESATIVSNGFSAVNVTAADVENFSTGADIQLSFDAPIGESFISEYRAFLSKGYIADTAVFSTFPVGTTVSILPNGGPYSFDFSGIELTVDGEPLVEEVEYWVYVVATLDAGKTFRFDKVELDLDSLRARDLSLSVNDDATGTAGDLSLSFLPALLEDRIASHKILFVEHDQVGLMPALAFGDLEPYTYFEVPPFADLPVQGFSEWMYSLVSGNLVQGGDYRAVILSTTTEATNAVKVLSEPSNLVSILPVATGIAGADQAKGFLFYTDGQLHVNTGIEESIPIAITDIGGTLLWESPGVLGAVSIDCSNWSKGIYLVNFKGEHPQLVKFSR